MKAFRLILLFQVLILFFGCSTDNPQQEASQNLTIFFVNDVHGQLDNFAKVKHIVDQEKETGNVILACSGDVFSGNPVVDNYTEKGFPMIDVMNQTGFDVAAIGNHEFDYGIEILKERIEQSDFEWICANLDSGNSLLPQPPAYTTITAGDLKVTFLGLVETNGKRNAVIPSTHPWKVRDLEFSWAQNVVPDFINTKNDEEADLFVALSHLGAMDDFELARNNYFFDLIIGGHSHSYIDTTINNVPVFQAGSYLNHLGKITMSVKNQSLENVDFNWIDLNEYPEIDAELQAVIDEYMNWPELNEVIGFAAFDHSGYQVGCFYTDALRLQLDVDFTFQNTGGVRAGLRQGNITKRDIYEIDPFNNGTMIYKMTVAEVEEFLRGSGSGFYYSGGSISKNGSEIIIRDLNGNEIPEDYVLEIGINDYIPAVHEIYFPDNGEVQPFSTAETIIVYLENNEVEVKYSQCYHYFRY
ncbi:MAG TPA: bifunctional UDP-sugar hydrolase/5'-nucleotidase [Tangfeifania sp.]|nr:bifunctional UDP-sugar hydrolase/5'-nucleotidase [Tangfeifania sp.]